MTIRIVVPDAEWDALLAAKQVSPAYLIIAHPRSFYMRAEDVIYVMESAVDDFKALVHECGHALKLPLSDHPTDVAGILEHANSVGFDCRAGTDALRLNIGPEDAVMMARTILKAEGRVAQMKKSSKQWMAEVKDSAVYMLKHFGMPLLTAVAIALYDAYQNNGMLTVKNAEHIAEVTAVAFVMSKFHGILMPDKPVATDKSVVVAKVDDKQQP